MTHEDGTRPDPLGPSDPDGLPDDGPMIDPRDPLGIGDLPPDEPEQGDASPEDVDPPEDVDAQEPAGRSAQPQAEVTPGHGAVVDEPGGEPRDDEVHSSQEQSNEVHSDEEQNHHGPVADESQPDEARDGEPTDHPQPDHAPSPDEQDPTAVVAPGAPPQDAAVGREPAVAPAATPVRPPRSGWTRLGHAMRPRTTQGQLITAGLCALLGFALVVQVRQATDTQLGALRQNDLVRLLDETSTRTDELERESLDLQRERDELLSGSDRQQAALDAARRTAAMQGILTGRLPATGPGVRITLTEPDAEIRPATMLHVLEELRNAGAEAMELNGRRIIASSAFTGARGAIELDGVTLESPYRWTVIGDPDTIAPALEIPGGAMAQVRKDGGRGTVEKSDRVEVTAVRVLPEPVHASPVADEP
ncbi:DUF881 domain-containing protein [Cellulomonas sp. Sa3CUA2]|uniref:DUF881 domain-containing protein n=1 Tax=Cellulomonas avistercoris TaxID=2762242 RepID=A0ABR8Q8Z8_9CELL|nr:DUF881 domain-containing protein [Cellulomonas avistercoris]MBD7916900.1 DUF881 domain-containing protein [Cellulomonas avistercoris]